MWVAHRRGWRLGVGLDALIPGIPLAQAIGRLGNWWNQELFGGPTSLPWGVQIDAKNRPLEYVTSTTFHPTFLYELLWNLALCYLLVRIDRTRRLRPGHAAPALRRRLLPRPALGRGHAGRHRHEDPRASG